MGKRNGIVKFDSLYMFLPDRDRMKVLTVRNEWEIAEDRRTHCVSWNLPTAATLCAKSCLIGLAISGWGWLRVTDKSLGHRNCRYRLFQKPHISEITSLSVVVTSSHCTVPLSQCTVEKSVTLRSLSVNISLRLCCCTTTKINVKYDYKSFVYI